MIAVVPGQVVSALQPAIHEYIIAAGLLTDVFGLEYVIETAPLSGVAGEQVFPDTGNQVADVVTDRIGVGHYCAAFTVPELDSGAYKVRWFVEVAEGDAIVELVTPFEVVASIQAVGPLYASVASMRAEGVPDTVPDYVIHAKLVGASRQFEMYTGRFFEPRSKTLFVDGRGSRDLLLGDPVVAVEAVQLLQTGTFSTGEDVDSRELRVYNRHLTQGLTDPDDRHCPMISWSRSDDVWWPRPHAELSLTWRVFPEGRQNIRVAGVFGYTEADGTATGGVPWMVQQAVRLLALRDMPALTDTDGREDTRLRWRLTGERTRDQAWTGFSGVDAATRAAVIGAVTGDPEIDRIIVLYRRGPRIGAA